jgi:hypothetical protein
MTLPGPRSGALSLGVCAVCIVIAACGDESQPKAEIRAASSGNGAMVELGCADGGPSTERTRRGNLPFGPFVLTGTL